MTFQIRGREDKQWGNIEFYTHGQCNKEKMNDLFTSDQQAPSSCLFRYVPLALVSSTNTYFLGVGG